MSWSNVLGCCRLQHRHVFVCAAWLPRKLLAKEGGKVGKKLALMASNMTFVINEHNLDWTGAPPRRKHYGTLVVVPYLAHRYVGVSESEDELLQQQQKRERRVISFIGALRDNGYRALLNQSNVTRMPNVNVRDF